MDALESSRLEADYAAQGFPAVLLVFAVTIVLNWLFVRWDRKREAAQLARAAAVLVASKSSNPPTNERADTTRDGCGGTSRGSERGSWAERRSASISGRAPPRG